MSDETKKSSLMDAALSFVSVAALFGTHQMRSSLAAGSAALAGATAEVVAKFERWTRYNAPAWAHVFVSGGFRIFGVLSLLELYAISQLADPTVTFWWNWLQLKLASLVVLVWYYARTSRVRFVPWSLPADVDPAPADYGEPNGPSLSAFVALELVLLGSFIGAIAARSSLCTYNGLDPLSTAPLVLIGGGYLAFAILYAVLISAIGRFGGEGGDWGFGVGGSIFRAVHAVLLPGVVPENSTSVLPPLSSPFGRVGMWVWRWLQALITASLSVIALCIFVTNAIVFPALSLFSITTSLAMIVLQRNGVGMFSFSELNTIERMKTVRAWTLYAAVFILGGVFVLEAANLAYHLTNHPFGLVGWAAVHAKIIIVTYLEGSMKILKVLIFVFMTMKWYTAIFLILPVCIIGFMLIVRHWQPEGRIGQFLKADALLTILTIAILTIGGFVYRVDGQTFLDRANVIDHAVTGTGPTPAPVVEPAATAQPAAAPAAPEAPQPGFATRLVSGLRDIFVAPSRTSTTPRGVPGHTQPPTPVATVFGPSHPSQPARIATRQASRDVSDEPPAEWLAFARRRGIR